METGARLILLHVLAAGEGIAVDAIGMPYYDPAGALDQARKTLEPWCAEARANGAICSCLVRERNASQQILTAVRQFRVGRILLGTRSRSKLGKLLIGSVAENVLRSVDIPVMTVGPAAGCALRDNIEGVLAGQFGACVPDCSQPEGEACASACFARC
jgi:nucleotide-binding universal stress UspA family protein